MARPSSANDALQRIARFYKAVQIEPVDGGYSILLDARPLRTPGKALLVTPTRAGADLIAGEWAAQEKYILFPHMPATRHAFTAIDRVSQARMEVAQEVARYAGSDLLCYHADEPPVLAARQAASWGPIIDWAEADLGLKFIRTAGIAHQTQPPQTLLRIEALALDLDDFRLAALAFGGALFGSSILALALEKGRISGDEAYELSRLDETFQEEQWGLDAEASERAENLRAEALLLERWLQALA